MRRPRPHRCATRPCGRRCKSAAARKRQGGAHHGRARHTHADDRRRHRPDPCPHRGICRLDRAAAAARGPFASVNAGAPIRCAYRNSNVPWNPADGTAVCIRICRGCGSDADEARNRMRWRRTIRSLRRSCNSPSGRPISIRTAFASAAMRWWSTSNGRKRVLSQALTPSRPARIRIM